MPTVFTPEAVASLQTLAVDHSARQSLIALVTAIRERTASIIPLTQLSSGSPHEEVVFFEYGPAYATGFLDAVRDDVMICHICLDR